MAVNFVKNSSFEVNTSANEMAKGYSGVDPTNWTRYAAAATAVAQLQRLGGAKSQPGAVPTQFHGFYSLYMLDSAAMAQGEYVGFIQDLQVTGWSVGQNYTFSVYARGFSNALDIALIVTWHDAAHAVVGGSQQALWTNAQFQALGTANGLNWVRLTQTVTMPVGATHAEIRIAYYKSSAGSTSGGATAQVVFDAVQFEAGSVATAYAPRAVAGDFTETVGDIANVETNDVFNNGEYLYRGAKLNEGNPYYQNYKLLVEECRGLLELPDVKSSGDYEDPAFHGGRLGFDRLSMRVVEMDLALSADTEIALMAAAANLRRLWTPRFDRTEDKLFFARPQWQNLGMGGMIPAKGFVYGRLRRFSGFDTNYESMSSGILRATAQWVCADPATYEWLPAVEQAVVPASNTSYQHSDGFQGGRGDFRDFTTFTITATGTVTNPTIAISQPNGLVSEPSYSRTFRLTQTLTAGQSVTIDMRNRTVTGPGGVDWLQYLSASSQWFYNPSVWKYGGNNTRFNRLVFGCSSNTAGYTVDITTHNAWL